MLALSRPLARLLVVPLLLASCAASRGASPGESGPLVLTVVATNDLHGWLAPHEAKLEDGRVVKAGGVAVFSSYLARLREENPGGVALVDAGDLFQGTLVANLSEGEAVITAYNALGYDAAALGNHEFDYGPVGPKSAAVDPGDDPCGALAARAAQAHFPLLAANVYLADGKRPEFFHNDGTFMFERKGVKIGVVGLLTPLTPQVTNPVNVANLRFGPLAEEAARAAARLRERGAEVLLLTIHAGGHCAARVPPTELAGCDPHGELFEMLKALPPGLFDAVITGHSHTRIAYSVNGMPVVQSNAFGLQFGWFTLELDPKTHLVHREATQMHSGVPICEKVFPGTDDCDAKHPSPGELVPSLFHGKAMGSDPAIEKLMAPYFARVEQEQHRSLKVAVPQALPRNYFGESLLGDALADATLAQEKTDAALLNAGGLRNDLPAGELTFGALYEVFPFDNSVATLTLTGDELVHLLEALSGSGHGAPQIAGLRIKVARCPKPHITEISFADGRPFDRAATYRLTTSDFLALGGDGTGPVVEQIPAARKDLGHRRALNMRDSLAQWLEKRGGALTAKLDGRLVYDVPSCPPP